MKHTIRLFLVLAALIAGSAGTVQAGTSDLAIVNQVAAADATIKTYVSDAVPTAPPLGTAATTIELGKYLVIEVTPADGKWTYSDLFKIEKGVGIGGAESRPRRANGDMNLGESPTALTTNKADGSGIYYYKIPTSWTDATAVFIHGSVIDKIDLSTATASTDGKTFTTADRTDGWKATIELDEVNFDYNSSTAQGPTISSISVTNGTKTMSTIADHVSISGNSQTNASDSYNATLTAVATGCLTGSVTVPFKIAKASTEITLNTPPGGGAVGQMYIDDTYTILNSFTPAEAGSLTYTLDKESVVTVDASGEVTAVGEGEVTITVSFAGNDNYAAATSKTMKIKVSKVPTEITFDPPYPNTEREGQLNVLDEYGGATLTPAEAGSLTYTYTPDDGSVVTIDNGKIKAVGAGTATITASFAGNNKYAAAVSKTITVNVSLYDASLAFGNVTKTFGDADFTPSPSTKTSDGAITFTSGNTNVITVGSDGKTLNIVAASATPVTITASQAASNSYNATTAEFTVTVNPKTVTVSGITASGKDYDGNTTATLVTTAATFTGIVTGDNLTITATGTFADKNAGKGKTVTLSGLTLGGTHAGNYTLATSGNQATTTADINEKTVELEWTNATPYPFNGNAQAPTATVKTASLVSGDACTVSNYSLAATSGSLTDGKAVNAGSYTITATTLSNSNYKLPTDGSAVMQSFSIVATTDATAVITANNRNYDGTTQALVTIGTVTYGKTGTAADVVFYENATSTTPLTGIPEKKDADEYVVYYEITPDDNHTKAARANMTVTISKLTVKVKAQDAEREEGAANPTFTVEYSGFLKGENESVLTTVPSCTTTATATSPAGSYPITPAGAVATNYDFTYTDGALTVYKGISMAKDWTTWYGNEDLTVSTDDMNTYVVTSVTASAIAVKSTNGQIYKNTPMLLNRKTSTTTSMKGLAPTTALTPPTGLSNQYIGGVDDLSTYASKEVYVLAGSEFVKVDLSGTGAKAFSPNKCFLVIDNAAGSRLRIVQESETADLGASLNDKGEMIIDKWYTLDGRKLDKMPTKKGLYIYNGKKIAIKQ